MSRKLKIAVILSGCGVQDGSEIHESVLTLLAISEAGHQAACFAPDIAQARVVNHVTGEETAERRNVLVEAARIARGKIQPLSELDPGLFDAVILPGGFGAALNLSTFASDGADCRLDPDLRRVLETFHCDKKPIAALCISPAIIARLFPGTELTVGQDEEVGAVLRGLGAKVKPTGPGEIVVDKSRKIVTAPCYMIESSLARIFEGVRNVIAALGPLC